MSPIISNSSPKEDRISFCNHHLKPGAVFREYVPHTSPKKIKRFVVISINEQLFSIALLFINSKKNPKVQDLNLFLAADKWIFLDDDSYLDCSRLYEWSLDILKRKFIAKPQIYLGKFSEADIGKVRKMVTSAKTVERKLKQRYGFI